MTSSVPDDCDPPETTPQIGALRAYVERREHADHDTFLMGREFAELLLAEYDRLLYLAEVKYELIASERGYDLHAELDGRLRKLYRTLNTEARGDTTTLEGEEIDATTKWNNLVELSVTAAVHWLANARWAVIEHRQADTMRTLLREAVEVLSQYHDENDYTEGDLMRRIELALEPPEKPEGAVSTDSSGSPGETGVPESDDHAAARFEEDEA